MKHIVCVHLLNDFSGSPKVLSQVISNFKAQDYTVDLYTGKSKSGFLSGLVKNPKYYFYKRFNNRYLTLVSFFLSQIILFFKLLQYKNKDVVFYVNTMLPFGAALAGKLLGKPVVYHIHETYLNPPILKRFLRFVIRNTANKVIFVSKSVKELESFPQLKQYLIYNALPKDFLVDYDYKWKINGDFNVLMISSLKAYKGIFEFVDIAKKIESNSEIKFTLVLNATEREIDTFYKAIKLPLNLSLVSKQKDVRPFYKVASLVLNLSKVDACVETFGLTILEAMAYGIPVIVPPVGGPSEIVTDAKEGYLIDSYNLETIAAKIIKLANDEATCMQLSKNAYQRSLDFSETTFNTQITAAIDA